MPSDFRCRRPTCWLRPERPNRGGVLYLVGQRPPFSQGGDALSRLRPRGQWIYASRTVSVQSSPIAGLVALVWPTFTGAGIFCWYRGRPEKWILRCRQARVIVPDGGVPRA